MAGVAVFAAASDTSRGTPARFLDAETARLRMLSATWRDFQQMRKALVQREAEADIVAIFAAGEKLLSGRLSRELRRHPLWPWLKQYPGLGGAHVATLVGIIGDPRRFPGQACSIGHILPPLYAVGSPCPLVADSASENVNEAGDENGAAGTEKRHVSEAVAETRCPGAMLEPRTATGTRALWHYCGLHVVNGHSPRKQKGQQADWNPLARTCVMQPGGIAEQIVRLGVPVYREVYDQAKERLAKERGADPLLDSEVDRGSANGAEADACREGDYEHGLRPFQIDARARKIAAKAFVGDLLRAWKTIA